MLRSKLISLLPLLARWLEVTPANCCGTCPTCIGTTVTGMLLPMAVKQRRDGDD